MKKLFYFTALIALCPLLTIAQTKHAVSAAAPEHPGSAIITGKVTDGNFPAVVKSVSVLLN